VQQFQRAPLYFFIIILAEIVQRSIFKDNIDAAILYGYNSNPDL